MGEFDKNKNEDMFYEIEYDSCPIPGAGKYVLKTQKIIEPEKDEIRERFNQMRDIARTYRSRYDYTRFFDKRVRNENGIIFYKQGMFMKDFTDDYKENVPFSQYFPYYQMMGYEQLRTYFTWRTKVRSGNITNTSLSYIYIYIYELLGNIGVENPTEGLERLVVFWKAIRVYDASIDKYVLQWLKDYHIYYELPHSFQEFIEKNNLMEYYPKLKEVGDSFDLFCSISKYDIRKSAFFSDETINMIKECFSFTIERIRQAFHQGGIPFDDVLFRPAKKQIIWNPFKGALFYPKRKQPDRQVLLSKSEIYVCSKNQWTFSTTITTEKGKQFMGYVIKQMEVVLRELTKYKFKMKVNLDMVNHETLQVLSNAGIYIDKIVLEAVQDFYREMTKTVVTVDPDSLNRIRQEAFATQEALIVEEPMVEKSMEENDFLFTQEVLSLDKQIHTGWNGLRESLTQTELKALGIILKEGDIKTFANECGIMQEVLIEGINEKAMDYIGDNLMDEGFVLYDDYKEQVKELAG